MNTTTIEKCLDLLNTGKIDDLRDLLNYERETNILASKGIKTSLLNAVKKIVCDNGLKEWRKELAGIQHTPDGKQFICNGYLLVKWNEEQPELNALPQTPANESINANNILCTTASMLKYELTDSDKIIAEEFSKLWATEYRRLFSGVYSTFAMTPEYKAVDNIYMALLDSKPLKSITVMQCNADKGADYASNDRN